MSKILLPLFTAILAILVMTGCTTNRRDAYASMAKGTLRSIGSSELAFQRSNKEKSYGTFEELQREQHIAMGYSPGNMIEGYTMEWTAYASNPTDEGEDGETEFADSSRTETGLIPHEVYDMFTIIAYPKTSSMGLQTFGITEDQVVRVYNPGNSNDLSDVKTWDPIL
jgi:hypothetical protein